MTPRTYLLSTWLDDGRPSGANRRLHALIEGLPEVLDPSEDVVVVRGPQSPPITNDRLRSIEVAIPAIPTGKRLAAERQLLGGLLQELSPSLIDLQGLPLLDLGGKPIVWTTHDLRGLGRFRRRPQWIMRRAIDRAVRTAAAIVVPSHNTAEELTAQFPGADVDVIPNALPSSIAGPLSRLERRAVQPFVLHVGHLEPRKNLEIILQALPDCPGLTLRTVGDDHGHRASLLRLAKSLGVADRWIHEGVVPDEKVLELYGSCLGVVVPSMLEGFGYAALEALTAGCPTMVAEGTATSEITGDQAEQLPPDHPLPWAKALEKLVSTELEQRDPDSDVRIGERRERARRFSSVRLAATTLAVWRRVSEPN